MGRVRSGSRWRLLAAFRFARLQYPAIGVTRRWHEATDSREVRVATSHIAYSDDGLVLLRMRATLSCAPNGSSVGARGPVPVISRRRGSRARYALATPYSSTDRGGYGRTRRQPMTNRVMATPASTIGMAYWAVTHDLVHPPDWMYDVPPT